MLGLLLDGFAAALTPGNVLLIAVGTALGLFVGAMPGLSSSVGLAIALPFTYVLSPLSAMLMMVCLYMAAMYGGSITAITLGVPGTPAAVSTTLDGYPLGQRGEAGKALGISILSSALGGAFGVVILIAAFAPLARVALGFGPAEYFALGVFGLSVVANLVGESVVKGLIGVVLGLLLFVVGLDVLSGYPRLTFGTQALLEGVPLVPALIGFFAVAEAFRLLAAPSHERLRARAVSGSLPSLAELRRLVPSLLRGSVIGAVVGAIPGAGATIASFIAWGEERRFSRTPERFGTGAHEGIAAPEAANNASVAAAMIPLLTLGIPGSASTAVLLGGFMIHGVNPGPLLVVEQAGLVYAIYAGFLLGTLCMLAIGLAGIPLWVRIVALPSTVLVPLILGVSILGAFASQQRVFDVWLTLLLGALGFGLRRLGFSLVTVILGLVLGSMVEANYRRALTISGGDPLTFLTSPVSLALLLLAALSFTLPLLRRRLVPGSPPTSSGEER